MQLKRAQFTQSDINRRSCDDLFVVGARDGDEWNVRGYKLEKEEDDESF